MKTNKQEYITYTEELGNLITMPFADDLDDLDRDFIIQYIETAFNSIKAASKKYLFCGISYGEYYSTYITDAELTENLTNNYTTDIINGYIVDVETTKVIARTDNNGKFIKV